MRTTRRPTPRLIALSAAALLLAASCSTSGGDDDAADPTTTTAPETTTEAGGDDGTTTTEGDEPVDGPSSGDLEALLPTAADLGEGWTQDPDEPDDEEDDDVMAEQCPDVAAMQTGDGDDSDEVTRTFSDADGATIEVTLTPTALQLSADEVDEYVAAINDCGEVTQTEGGRTTTIAFEALADDSYGEVGFRLQGDVTVSSEQFPQDVNLAIYGLIWRDGPVGVEINATDGVDTETYESIPVDTDLAIQLADELDPAVADLVG